MYLMSAPAANARSPAPVSTTTRTAGVARQLLEPIPELRQRLDVERVQRLGPVDRDEGDAVLAPVDPDGYATGTLSRRNSTISRVGAPGVNTAATP